LPFLLSFPTRRSSDLTIFFKMTLTFHSGLLKDISLTLNDAKDFNVTIQVGEKQKMKKFHAHSVILCARCPYFKLLSTDWVTKELDRKSTRLNSSHVAI